MGFSSQEGHVGFKTQSSKGVFTNPGTNGVFMRTRSGALAGNRELLIPDPEVGGSRDLPDAYLGPIKFSGTYDFYPRMDSFATLLWGAFGTKSSSSTGSGTTLVGTHAMTPKDQGPLPWLSVEEQIGGVYEVFHYTDVKVNTLHLEADANGYLMGSVGLVGLGQTAVGSASATAAPAFDISPMIVGTNVTISFDGVQLPAKSFSFDINNNLEDDDFRLGSLFLGDAIEHRRELSFGATIRPNDDLLWKQAMYGDPTRSTAGGTVVKKAVTLTAATYEVIGTTTTVYSTSWSMPKAVIAPFEVNPSGEDAIQHDIEIRALRIDPATPICSATVVNHLAAVA